MIDNGVKYTFCSAAVSRRLLLIGGMAAVAGGALRSAPLRAETPGRTAIQGYDPVSYFTPGRPEQGSAAFCYPYDATNYLFTSDKHRKLFAANPARYAPLYRGYCVTGVSKGVKFDGDPQQWTIRNGKLLVFGNAAAKAEFEADPAGVAKRASLASQTLKNN
jgi:YHS domain-containing protein